jgi:alpha-L-arabinofuranosidase
LKDEELSEYMMTRLVFEDIGGEEVLSISRNDTVFGENLIYQPIKNMISLAQKYNSQNLLSLYGTSQSYFDNFLIKFDDKIPNIGNGTNGSNFYIENSTGDLIIEVVNMQDDEEVEVSIMVSGDILRDTI